MVLGKLPAPGRPTIWITVEQGSTALVVGAGGVVWTFLLSSILFSSLSPSLWETARYRLKYCLKGLLNLKQPTNHLFPHFQGRQFSWLRFAYLEDEVFPKWGLRWEQIIFL